jgi:hypothetical protein
MWSGRRRTVDYGIGIEIFDNGDCCKDLFVLIFFLLLFAFGFRRDARPFITIGIDVSWVGFWLT